LDRESGMPEEPEPELEKCLCTYIYDVACLGNPSLSLKLYFH
jgi:hypothetical protein